MPALYSFISLAICLDDQRRVLMVQEARPDCRGQFYVPAGHGQAGEDPLRIAWRVTQEKTGLITTPLGILGIEHNPPVGQFPGQLRVYVLTQPTGGALRVVETEHAMAAGWVAHGEVRALKLRSSDFLTWMDDAVLGHVPVLPPAQWRTLGSPV